MGEKVNVDNFVRAETARMFDGLLGQSGGLNQWLHQRGPVPLDAQTVIRMNRDTLYSSAIVDLRQGGATFHLPEVGDRYVSAMVIDEDHQINRVLHRPGDHLMTMSEHRSAFVALVVRVFADPDDLDDVTAANAVQDGLGLHASSAGPYVHPDYDHASLDHTRNLLLQLAEGLPDSRRTFGAPDEVDPVRHLLGSAVGWGGLPEHEAFYIIEAEPRPARHERITFKKVPVDAFWSLTVYNRQGYLEKIPSGRHSLNSVTARPDPNGEVTIDLAPTDEGYLNHLFVMEGWNYVIRCYRPRPEILNGRWTPPAPQPVD